MMNNRTIRNALLTLSEHVSRKRDGEWVIKQYYFYKHGLSAEEIGRRVFKKLSAMGFDVTITRTEDHWNSWPRDSWFEVGLRIK